MEGGTHVSPSNREPFNHYTEGFPYFRAMDAYLSYVSTGTVAARTVKAVTKILCIKHVFVALSTQ